MLHVFDDDDDGLTRSTRHTTCTTHTDMCTRHHHGVSHRNRLFPSSSSLKKSPLSSSFASQRKESRRTESFGSAAEGEEYHGGGDWKMVAGPERALVRCDGSPFRARVQSADDDVLAMQKCGVVNVQNNFALLDAYFGCIIEGRRSARGGPDVTGDFRAKRFASSEINVVDVSFVSSGLSSNDSLPIFNANLHLRVFRLFRHAV